MSLLHLIDAWDDEEDLDPDDTLKDGEAFAEAVEIVAARLATPPQEEGR